MLKLVSCLRLALTSVLRLEGGITGLKLAVYGIKAYLGKRGKEHGRFLWPVFRVSLFHFHQVMAPS